MSQDASAPISGKLGNGDALHLHGPKVTDLTVPTRALGSDGEQTALIVCGMHRSGTSALTRVLGLIGCELPKTLLPASPGDNDRGFWESRAIKEFNEELLASAGSKWDDWTPFNKAWYHSPLYMTFQTRAQQLVQSEFGGAPLFALKDPRICRILEFWIAAIQGTGAVPLVVCPIRDPREVAASLKKRSQIPEALGHLLWLRHVLDAEAGSRGLVRSFVSYDDLLTNWQEVASKLGSDLGLSWPRVSASVDAEVEEFLSPALRHHHGSGNQLENGSASSAWVRSACEIFSRWTRSDVREQDLPELDRIRLAFNEAAPVFARALRKSRELAIDAENLNLAVVRLREKVESAEKERALAAQQSESLTKKAESKLAEAVAADAAERVRADQLGRELEGERRRSEAALKEIEAKLSDAESAVGAERARADQIAGELESERQRSAAALTEIGAKLTEVEAERAAEEERVIDLQGRVSYLQCALGQRRSELEETAATLAAVRKDVSKAAADANRQEKVSLGLAQHVQLLMQDLSTQKEAFRAERVNVEGEIRELREALSAAVSERDKARSSFSEKIKDLRHRTMSAVLQLAEPTRVPFLGSKLSQRIQVRSSVRLLLRSGLFDSEWYLKHYKDVAKAGMDPARHYVLYGRREGRAPNPDFDV